MFVQLLMQRNLREIHFVTGNPVILGVDKFFSTVAKGGQASFWVDIAVQGNMPGIRSWKLHVTAVESCLRAFPEHQVPAKDIREVAGYEVQTVFYVFNGPLHLL